MVRFVPSKDTEYYHRFISVPSLTNRIVLASKSKKITLLWPSLVACKYTVSALLEIVPNFEFVVSMIDALSFEDTESQFGYVAVFPERPRR